MSRTYSNRHADLLFNIVSSRSQQSSTMVTTIRPFPGTDRTRVAADTIRGWIKLYRDGGFDALYPKPRTDRGQPRRLPPEVAERLVALKTENPAHSVRIIIGKARAEGIDQPLAPSTVHRLFSREGLFDRAPPDGADRRRFVHSAARNQPMPYRLLIAG